MAECGGELGLNANVAINAKGGDCWGKRPRAVGSHSKIPTAVGSGEAAQRLSAGVGVQKK
jgi:hypothetical protein